MPQSLAVGDDGRRLTDGLFACHLMCLAHISFCALGITVVCGCVDVCVRACV